MNLTTNLRLKKIINKISKEKTLIQIVEYLEDFNIDVKGSLSSSPKKQILIKSLKNAKESTLLQFLKKFESEEKQDLPKKQKSIINLHEEFIGTKVEKFLNDFEYEEAIRVAFMRIANKVKK